MRTNQPLSAQNLDWTQTSSLGTADLSMDITFREFIKSKRSLSVSAISYKDDFLRVSLWRVY